MKTLQPLTFVQVLTTANRIRHARVETVVNQNQITASVGRGTPFTANRVNSTATRGKIFQQA